MARRVAHMIMHQCCLASLLKLIMSGLRPVQRWKPAEAPVSLSLDTDHYRRSLRKKNKIPQPNKYDVVWLSSFGKVHAEIALSLWRGVVNFQEAE